MPPVRLHRGAGRRAGDTGVDKAGHRRPGRRPGRHERGRAGLAGPAGLLNSVPAQRARLLLAQGDLGGAARWAADRGLRTDDHPDYPREPGHLVLARVLLGQDRPGLALPLLDRLYTAAAAQDRTGSLIEIGVLRALALAARGEETARWTPWPGRSRWAARKAISGSSPTRGRPWPRCWAWLIAAQRAGHAAAAVPLGCLARLQRAFAPEQATPARGRGSAAGLPGLVEPLTPRELEVLGMLAAGRSNQVIATELVGHPRHRQEARQPCAGQARRGQPDRGRRPGQGARTDPLRIPPIMSTFG